MIRTLLCVTAFVLVDLVLTFDAFAASGAPVAGDRLLIPAAGRVDGAYDSEWHTDLTLINVSGRQRFVTAVLTFHPVDGEPVVREVVLGSRSSVVLEDVVLTTFGLERSFGMITIDSPQSNAMLSATASIYNARGMLGRVGQVVHAVAMDSLGNEVTIPGLTASGSTRANLGLVNPGDVEVIVELLLLNGSGRRTGGAHVILPPRSVRQYSDLFSLFRSEPMGSATVVALGYEPIYAYATMTRNDSGDSEFIEGVLTFEGHEVITPACQDPAQLSLTPYPAPGWFIVLRDDPNRTEGSGDLVERYGFTFEQSYSFTNAFLATQVSHEMIAGLRCEPSVQSIEQNARGFFSGSTRSEP